MNVIRIVMIVKLKNKQRFFNPSRFSDCSDISPTSEDFEDLPANSVIEAIRVEYGTYVLKSANGLIAKVDASWVNELKSL
jgi:hypothetical protein